jgi:hypothetical protein
VLLAAVLACPIAAGIAYASLLGSAMFFDHRYPYDGQSALGAVFVGLMAGLVGWVVVFMLLMWLFSRWLYRKPSELGRGE